MSLLHAIETCLNVTNVPPSRFGRESVRDPRLVHDLRRGRQPGERVQRRVRAYIAATISRLPESEGKAKALRRLASIPMPAAPREPDASDCRMTDYTPTSGWCL